MSPNQNAAGPAPTAIYGEAGPPEWCFPPTGRCVRGLFRAHWEAHGGLAINGYPVTEERRGTLEDGRVYTVQYFERARFELHPENKAPYDVLLGQLGRQLLDLRAAFPTR